MNRDEGSFSNCGLNFGVLQETVSDFAHLSTFVPRGTKCTGSCVAFNVRIDKALMPSFETFISASGFLLNDCIHGEGMQSTPAASASPVEVNGVLAQRLRASVLPARSRMQPLLHMVRCPLHALSVEEKAKRILAPAIRGRKRSKAASSWPGSRKGAVSIVLEHSIDAIYYLGRFSTETVCAASVTLRSTFR